jgi:hypothetical protein
MARHPPLDSRHTRTPESGLPGRNQPGRKPCMLVVMGSGVSRQCRARDALRATQSLGSAGIGHSHPNSCPAVVCS